MHLTVQASQELGICNKVRWEVGERNEKHLRDRNAIPIGFFAVHYTGCDAHLLASQPCAVRRANEIIGPLLQPCCPDHRDSCITRFSVNVRKSALDIDVTALTSRIHRFMKQLGFDLQAKMKEI